MVRFNGRMYIDFILNNIFSCYLLLLILYNTGKVLIFRENLKGKHRNEGNVDCEESYAQII